MTYRVHFFGIECPPGQFGLVCGERCSGHCINNESCNHVSGVCARGCQDGFLGTHCTNGEKFLVIL